MWWMPHRPKEEIRSKMYAAYNTSLKNMMLRCFCARRSLQQTRLTAYSRKRAKKIRLTACARLFRSFRFTRFPVLPVRGIRALTYGILEILRGMEREITVFEPEMEISYDSDRNLPYTIERDGAVFVVEGPRIEKMLGYTNLESEKGFNFFQGFLKDSGILEDLEKAGIQDGDTVRMYGHEFDYYK